jgi:hypothetical protein
MADVVRGVVAVAVAVWVAWNLYRHIAVYAFRRRVIVVTERVAGNLVAGAGLLPALAIPSLVTAATGALAIGIAVVLRSTGVWVILGASAERIFDRGGLVLRGMSFGFDAAGDRSLEDRSGRIRVAILGSLTPLTHVLRVRPARGINKVALFRANLRKFLVAVPRQRRGSG